MQARRAHGLTPLAIVLPHPPLPRRTSSLLSLNSASPRTPRSCGSPTCSSIFPVANRKSTDSWNSSNGPDDLESEWKPEQVLLLSRTLDALPAHLVTPFNGPIPPSNLLDKIARGVSQAKGPADWPHSLRATRVKLIELSRSRAKEQAAAEQQRKIIAEESESVLEDDANYAYFQGNEGKPVAITASARRPLYRQSSMDFMNAVGTDVKNNEHLARLSTRLQRAERQASHHPYHRASRANMRCTSPPPPSNVPSLINPSTPSSSTLNTLSSFSSQPRVLRRTISSVSSLSILSSSSDGVLPNPRIQRLMRDDTLAPVPPPKDTPAPGRTSIKRAPSFSALAQESRREYLTHTPIKNGHVQNHPSGCPSSDEEEKIRSKQAKKPRKQTTPATRATPPPESSAPSTPASSPVVMRRNAKSSSKADAVRLEVNTKIALSSKSPKERRNDRGDGKEKVRKENLQTLDKGSKLKHPAKPLPMNLQRNPSILGAELPHPKHSPLSTVYAISPKTSHIYPQSPSPAAPRRPPSTLRASPALSPSPASEALIKPTLLDPGVDLNLSPVSTQRVKTLRRVRRLAPARRISFSSLVPPGDEADADGEGEGEEKGGHIELGSAFQLH